MPCSDKYEYEFVPTMETILDMLFELTATDECSKEEIEIIDDVRVQIGSLCINHSIK